MAGNPELEIPLPKGYHELDIFLAIKNISTWPGCGKCWVLADWTVIARASYM